MGLLGKKMKKTAKTSNSNIKKMPLTKTSSKKEPKNPRIYSEYFDTNACEYRITTDDWALSLGKRFVSWCSEIPKDVRDIPFNPMEFFDREGVTYEDLEKLVLLYNPFKQLFHKGLRILGRRREKGSAACEGYKPLNSSTVNFTQWFYDPIWEKTENRTDARKTQIALASEGSVGNTEIHVHMDQIPSSGVVPDKKKDSDED